MRRLFRPATLLFVVLAITLPAAADKAHTLWNRGRDAEQRQDYEKAYDYYQEAFSLKPKDLRYRTAYEHIKFLASASHVHRGQLLRDSGKLDEAVVEFQKAATIDPSSFVAQQELKKTQEMINQANNPQQAVAPTPNLLKKILNEAQGPVELESFSNVPITLKMTEDTKVTYETVGKLAGINVLFDPDYTSRKIRIELNGVTLEEALGIIALESKTFWRPVTRNTIFVAQDNPAKRKELDQSVIKTFYLSNLSQATELQDVVNAMRTLLEVSRIQQLQSQNAIIVRGTPDQIALAQKLVDDLDKAKPEVVIDIVVMQVSRDKSRTLGITPPTSTSISLNNNINQTTTTVTGPAGGTGTVNQSSGSGNGGINLNRIGNLNATDFTITIPGITASAIMGDSDTKIIQNPQIRALDGQKATLKIGDRVPVATGSFQPGIGGVGINPLVNTQFQYLDVGVNIDITPRVHAGREVTLKVSLDISSVTGQSNIGGISRPIIGQRKVEHEIRLREGEVNLLGGMMEDSQTRSMSGWPILANIPFLKYFFGSETKDHSEQELVFALIPHIIRGMDVNDQNQRLIDVGTANSLELRRVAKQQAETPAPTAAPAQAPAQTPPPQAARPVTQPATPPAAGGTSFLFDPGTIAQTKGATFTVNVLISGAQNVYSVPLQLNYDPSKLQLVNVSNGGFLAQDGQAVALVHREDEATGTLQITATRPPNSGGVSGQGSVVTLTFMAKASGQSPLTITRGGARDPAMQPITVNGAQAIINIQ